ncbi:hypothetical protein OAB57_00375 [Bacteriovoracaceae bacterium]|nr:hypothetical protein [Bacteriovoracaceae bacterium]
MKSCRLISILFPLFFSFFDCHAVHELKDVQRNVQTTFNCDHIHSTGSFGTKGSLCLPGHSRGFENLMQLLDVNLDDSDINIKEKIAKLQEYIDLATIVDTTREPEEYRKMVEEIILSYLYIDGKIHRIQNSILPSGKIDGETTQKILEQLKNSYLEKISKHPQILSCLEEKMMIAMDNREFAVNSIQCDPTKFTEQKRDEMLSRIDGDLASRSEQIWIKEDGALINFEKSFLAECKRGESRVPVEAGLAVAKCFKEKFGSKLCDEDEGDKLSCLNQIIITLFKLTQDNPNSIYVMFQSNGHSVIGIKSNGVVDLDQKTVTFNGTYSTIVDPSNGKKTELQGTNAFSTVTKLNVDTEYSNSAFEKGAKVSAGEIEVSLTRSSKPGKRKKGAIEKKLFNVCSVFQSK